MADQHFGSGKQSGRDSSARRLFAARDAFRDDAELRAAEAADDEHKPEGSAVTRGAFAGYVPNEAEIANAGREPQGEHTPDAEANHAPENAYTGYTPNEPPARVSGMAGAASAASSQTGNQEDAYAGYTPNEPPARDAQPSAASRRRAASPADARVSAADMPAVSQPRGASPKASAAEYHAPASLDSQRSPDVLPVRRAVGPAQYDVAPSEPVDFSAYYRRDSLPVEESSERIEPTFAPPPKMDAYFTETEARSQEPADTPVSSSNIYRPREATWAEAERQSVADSEGYQVRADKGRKKRRRRRKRHPVRNTLLVMLMLLVLCGTAYLLREDIGEWVSSLSATPEPSVEAFQPVTTPEPVKGYDAAPALDIADGTRARISAVSGTVQMETCAVTELNVLTRNLRPDGLYDYYLFTSSEGRLLCYFDGLGALDMYPQEDGGFYVRQAPYLVGANGAAIIRTADLEACVGEPLRLNPLYHGWAVIEGERSGSANYISTGGQLISNLWFTRAFPFTGRYTLAYVDTGAMADPQQRYLLYILCTDGSMSRWLATGDTGDVVAAVNGMAYMNNGDLYRLPDTVEPLVSTPRVDAYVDCDAMVVQDAETGKYALYVRGEQHYDFAYDSIRPVESDIRWTETLLAGEGGVCAVHTTATASYPQPLAHYFLLERDGQTEYVALSAVSTCPIVLEGELAAPGQE